MVCKKCGYQNHNDAVFCSGCGAKLVCPEKNICKRCGSENERNVLFCNQCGTDLRNTRHKISVKAIVAVVLIALMIVIGIFTWLGRMGGENSEVQNHGQSNALNTGKDLLSTSDNEVAKIEVITQVSNELMEDIIPIVRDYYDPNETYNAFGLSILREDVCSITFYNSLDNAPTGRITDVSMKKNGSVVAWVEPDAASEFYNLYIAADGEIIAPKDCTGLFSNYNNLKEINFNDCFDTSRVETMANMFGRCYELTKLDVSGFDTKNVTNMEQMFASMFCVKKLDLSSFDTSNVVTMGEMFAGCDQLSDLNVSSFDTGNVCDMNSMFSLCTRLESLDLSNFDVSNVTNMYNMFARCSALKELDLNNFDTSSVLTMAGMFQECESLVSLDLSNFDTANVSNMSCMFRRCYNLKYLDVSNFDYSSIADDSYLVMMFDACYSLPGIK